MAQIIMDYIHYCSITNHTMQIFANNIFVQFPKLYYLKYSILQQPLDVIRWHTKVTIMTSKMTSIPMLIIISHFVIIKKKL